MKFTESGRENTIRRLYGRQKWRKDVKQNTTDLRCIRPKENLTSMTYPSLQAFQSLLTLLKTYTLSVVFLEIIEIVFPQWVETSLKTVTLLWFSFLKYALPITDGSLVLISKGGYLPRSAVALVTGIFFKDIYKLLARKRNGSSFRMTKPQSGISNTSSETAVTTSGKWQDDLKRYIKSTIYSLKRHYFIVQPKQIPQKQSRQSSAKSAVYPSGGRRQRNVSFQYDDTLVPLAQTRHACMYTDTERDLSTDDNVTLIESSCEDENWQPTPYHSRYAPSNQSFASSVIMATDTQSSSDDLEEEVASQDQPFDQSSFAGMDSEVESFALTSNLHTASTLKYPIASRSYPEERTQQVCPQSTSGLHQRFNSLEQSVSQYKKIGAHNPYSALHQTDARLENNLLPSYSKGDNVVGPSHFSKASETDKRAQVALERTREWLENNSARSSTVKMGRICSERIKQPSRSAVVRQRNRNVAAVIEETRRIGFAQHYLRPKKDK